MSKINLNKLRLDLSAQPFTGDLLSLILRDRALKCSIQSGMSIYDDDTGDGIITVKMFGTEAYSAWRTRDLDTWFTYEKEKLMAKAEDDPVWLKVGTAEFDHAAVNLCSAHFMTSALSETTKALYRIEDWDTRQVSRVGDAGKDRLVEFARAVSATWAQDNVGVTQKRIEALILSYMSRAHVEPAPSLLGQPGGTDFCLHRADVLPDASVPWPLTRQFTSRLWDPEAYGAYFWGLYSGQNEGRQIAWISDTRGEGGKSKLIGAQTKRLFGDRICSSYPANNFASRNPHASSAFVGKRLVIVGDCRNTYLLHSVAFKELSGDDPSFVNAKYIQPYTTKFFCRALVLSNYAPVIMGDRHNVSRTLWIPLDPLKLAADQLDPHYGERCVAELPGFLFWCRTCYEQRCSNHYEIAVNDRVAAAVKLRIAESESQYSDPFDELFTLDPEGLVTAKDWARMCRELRFDQNASNDFRNWVLARHEQVTEAFDPKRPTRWSLEGLRPRRGGDHWREHAQQQPQRQPDDERAYVFDNSMED